MIFSDPVFLLLFLPLTLVLHRVAARYDEAAAQWVIVVASLVFYAAWDIRWLPLLVGTIVLNIMIGRLLIRGPTRTLLIGGIVINLAPLILAKYAGWLSGGYVLSDIVLPLGISFFTFQQIGFLVDAYQGKVESVDARHYTLFVSFFSQLVAGPICHHRFMLNQFREKFTFSDEDLTRALVLILAGLFKKAVIADRLAPYADRLFDGSGVVSVYEAWIGSLAYTFQLLFDFAGYCEMAMGFALLFGYKIPVNFLSPYKSRSITEFWRRWHISLSSFFRDYVYIPLGGNRHGATRMYLALFATAFVSGIWHGAGMTFLIWGVMHGTMLILEKAGRRAGIGLPGALQLVLTFLFVSLAWVMFRAPSVDTAFNIYGSLLGVNGYISPPLLGEIFGHSGEMLSSLTGFEVFVMAGLLWWVWTRPNVHELDLRPTFRAYSTATAAAVVIVLSITRPTSFLYFNF